MQKIGDQPNAINFVLRRGDKPKPCTLASQMQRRCKAGCLNCVLNSIAQFEENTLLCKRSTTGVGTTLGKALAAFGGRLRKVGERARASVI